MRLTCSAPAAGGATVHAPPTGGAGGDVPAVVDEDAVPSSSVSQRDLHRVFKALRFFWNHLIRRDLNYQMIIQERLGRSSVLLLYVHSVISCMCIAFTVCFVICMYCSLLWQGRVSGCWSGVLPSTVG